ncbi:MAG: hypothetical protein JNK23_06645 [Opitutaceae bacterium]|nr:hypothetical protein [Opitutaceae bacterium]
MSTLHASLAQRRAEMPTDDPRLCYAVASAVTAITFTTWKSGVWVLPWIHFLGAHHVAHAKGERIAFVFAQYEISAEGLRLAMLMPEIAAARLSVLREVPERFAADLPAEEPCVLRLVVKSRLDLAGGPPVASDSSS